MRTIILILVVLSLHGRAHAQDSTKLERLGYVVGATAVFSLADYIGYAYVRGGDHAPPLYRAAQIALQAGLSYFLYKQCGLNSAISFNLIIWTWGGDMAYYGWANLLNPKRPFENRNWNGMQSRLVNWAGWTPIGLLRKPGSWIDKGTLVSQSMIGFSIAVAIL